MQHRLVALPRRRKEGSGHAVAGVVDERIDREPTSRKLLHSSAGVSLRAEITRDHVHATAGCALEPRRHVRRRSSRRAGDDQVEAVGGKHIGEGSADAGRGAGDQSGPRGRGGGGARVR